MSIYSGRKPGNDEHTHKNLITNTDHEHKTDEYMSKIANAEVAKYIDKYLMCVVVDANCSKAMTWVNTRVASNIQYNHRTGEVEYVKDSTTNSRPINAYSDVKAKVSYDTNLRKNYINFDNSKLKVVFKDDPRSLISSNKYVDDVRFDVGSNEKVLNINDLHLTGGKEVSIFIVYKFSKRSPLIPMNEVIYEGKKYGLGYGETYKSNYIATENFKKKKSGICTLFSQVGGYSAFLSTGDELHLTSYNGFGTVDLYSVRKKHFDNYNFITNAGEISWRGGDWIVLSVHLYNDETIVYMDGYRAGGFGSIIRKEIGTDTFLIGGDGDMFPGFPRDSFSGGLGEIIIYDEKLDEVTIKRHHKVLLNEWTYKETLKL